MITKRWRAAFQAIRCSCPPGSSDRGQAMMLTLGIVMMVWLFAGIVIDGGLALAGKVRALDVAQEAARTGAQQLDLAALRHDDHVRLKPGAARQAAYGYVTAAGEAGTVQISEDEVTVAVTHRQPTQILKLIGVGHLTLHSRAVARLERGVTQPDGSSARR